MPAVDTFVKTLSQQTYTVEAVNSRFDLTKIKLTGDNNLWLDLSL